MFELNSNYFLSIAFAYSRNKNTSIRIDCTLCPNVLTGEHIGEDPAQPHFVSINGDSRMSVYSSPTNKHGLGLDEQKQNLLTKQVNTITFVCPFDLRQWEGEERF